MTCVFIHLVFQRLPVSFISGLVAILITIYSILPLSPIVHLWALLTVRKTVGFKLSDLSMATITDDDRIELELLRDQEIDALVEEALIPEEERWNVEMRNGFILHHPEVIIEITTGHPYPAGPLECQVKNLTMPRIIVDRLRVALRHSTQIDNGANSIEKWTDRGMLRKCEPFEFEMAVLHIARKTKEFLTQYRRDLEKHEDDTEENTGIDLSTIQGHVSINSLLGRTPEQICAGVPEHFRILHIESVRPR